MVEGVGVWYLYEITLCLHAGNLLRHTLEIIKVSLVAVKQTWI
jgi:hypothetical protein